MKKRTTNRGCTVFQTSKGRGNSYLVLDDNISVLVDTGLKKYREKLIQKIDHLLEGGKLSYLVLTHSHYDHTENAAFITEEYKAKIIIHRKEAEYLVNGLSPIPNGTNFLTRLMVGFGRRINIDNLVNYEKTRPDIMMDGIYSLSPKCYLIDTPGHTEGSISLIVDDEVALVGDAMFGVFQWSVFPPFANDVPNMIRSWNKLLGTGCNVYLPGHGTENSRKLLEKQYGKYKKRYFD